MRNIYLSGKYYNAQEKISIPEHAHAVQTFDGWDCDTGFTKNYHENRCDKISND